jgi:signal transduction histidine kinase
LSRFRHLLLVVMASLPLLAIVLVVLRQADLGNILAAVALWVVGVGVFAAWTWRETIMPLAEVVHELEAKNAQHARWRVREVKDAAAECADQRSQLTRLIEDLSHGLGEGLMVVTHDLRVRLINPRALHFFGVDQVAKDGHLLDVVRTPEVVEVVRNAADGGDVRRIMVENPRGLWEVRAFAMREGGAVVLVSEVGLIRRSAELRRRFVQDLSHELRSPLAVMRTTVEAMEEDVDTRLSEMLIRQVERITRLTDELYELATIEAGQVDLNPEHQLLQVVVQEILADFQSVAESARVELRLEVPDDLACYCDRRGLSRVLSNLVDNAVKYNREGGWVQVRGWSTEREVHIEVADNGLGIPADEIGAVMQRFYRIDRARTPGGGGLGLGLAIVKHMVQQMGGNLAIDSREGVGTQVTLSLPGASEVPSAVTLAEA